MRAPGMGWSRLPLFGWAMLVYSYLIVYRFETQPLQVIRVLHAARDVQSILGLTSEEE